MAALDTLSFILFLGLFFKALGFLIRDELLLRSFVVLGMICDIVFYLFRAETLWQSVFTNGLLVSINLGLMIFIIFERSTLGFSQRDRALYDHFPTLQPGQFRRILRSAKWHVADTDKQLAVEGKPLDTLYFLDCATFSIEKRGRVFEAQGPSFAGELVFLGGGTSSASVWVPKGAHYVGFDSAPLKRTMKRSPALRNGMIALFGSDLARKVANSVPLEVPDAAPMASEDALRQPAQ